MASPDRLGEAGCESKTWVTNLRVTIAERDHLKKVASDRSLTVSELIRQALAKEGVLPAQ
jgi:chromosome condensin MukBEF MukE localization factor